MAQRYMKWMLVSRTSDKGFTILEMMVGIAMTLTVSALALAALSNAESGFSKDKNKIEGGQKLSAVLDIVGRDIVQAGEQINEPKFPVIKIVADGVRGSKIVIYRATEEALSTCNALSTAAMVTSITVVMDTANFSSNTSCNASTVNPPVPATAYPIHPSNVTAWNNKSPTATTPVKFYLHDGIGYMQQVNLTGITAPTTQSTLKKVDLTTTSFTPGAAFPIKSTAYLVEKTQYLICGNALISRVNNDDENDTPGTPCTKTGDRTIANNIIRMDIATPTATTPNPNPTPSTNVAFPTGTQNWRDLRGVIITITVTNPDANTSSPIVASGRFYPRNILSTNAQ
jgi:ribosomal protein L24